MGHRRLPGRFVGLAAIAVVLLAIHGLVLRYVSASLALPAVGALAVIVLVLLKHLGLLGSLFAGLRRRARPKRSRHEQSEP